MELFMDSIPYFKHVASEEEEELVLKAIRLSNLSKGIFAKLYEQAVADYIKVPYVLAVTSGTAGLELCARAINVVPGDEIIVPSFTFMATANIIVHLGATPVFCDIDSSTLNIDVNSVKEHISSRTKMLLPVHLFGYPADIEQLNQVARANGLAIVEDGAQALGAQYAGGQNVGSSGNLCVFSTAPNKQITTGEGGLITIATEESYRLLETLSSHGYQTNDLFTTHTAEHYQQPGWNYRIDEIRASLGLAQIEHLESILEERRQLSQQYAHLLRKLPVTLPYKGIHKRSWFTYVILLEQHIDRSQVISLLRELGISTRACYPPVHLHRFYQERFGYRPGMLPVTEIYANRTLGLPLFNGMTIDEQERVVTALECALERYY
jgi:perosamine synthetase